MFVHQSSSHSWVKVGGLLPNMRLKLAGGDRSKGSGVLCAGAHELSFYGRLDLASVLMRRGLTSA